ncbi:hypothetical protein ROR02_00040 [Pararhodospirillum oryzae]|uniref:Uncharacterized protein n=1 Tax=Pararhodospirillum oryzae TaxID=478448 RepID=A0A512H366_9PROT|nr:hypothetical protein ROR02_00040 [Pararhodospirillum oryzae]
MAAEGKASGIPPGGVAMGGVGPGKASAGGVAAEEGKGSVIGGRSLDWFLGGGLAGRAAAAPGGKKTPNPRQGTTFRLKLQVRVRIEHTPGGGAERAPS